VKAIEATGVVELWDTIDQARILIGAKNDNVSDAVKENNINQAWHLLNNLLKATEQREAQAEAENVGIAEAINQLCKDVHADNVKVGWWTNPHTGESILETRNVPEMICLMHSELSEGLEGFRKNLMDDHLPAYPMLAVELADTIIRIADLAGAKGFPLGEIIEAKRAYNRTRADHKLENRLKDGGKAI
ncbi:MAG TPA: hypothetical protein VN081_02160, partial [Dongiaceae bacterium]|nr:hypothetical protein [Dongiaceae bacterium]